MLSFALPPRIDRVEPAHARGSYPRGLRSCPFYKHKRGSRHSSSVFDSGAESNTFTALKQILYPPRDILTQLYAIGNEPHTLLVQIAIQTMNYTILNQLSKFGFTHFYNVVTVDIGHIAVKLIHIVLGEHRKRIEVKTSQLSKTERGVSL